MLCPFAWRGVVRLVPSAWTYTQSTVNRPDRKPIEACFISGAQPPATTNDKVTVYGAALPSCRSRCESSCCHGLRDVDATLNVDLMCAPIRFSISTDYPPETLSNTRASPNVYAFKYCLERSAVCRITHNHRQTATSDELLPGASPTHRCHRPRYARCGAVPWVLLMRGLRSLSENDHVIVEASRGILTSARTTAWHEPNIRTPQLFAALAPQMDLVCYSLECPKYRQEDRCIFCNVQRPQFLCS
jgi:hypothetical protein